MMRQKNKTVLLVGGYGVVGAQVARLIRNYHPDWRILIGGRAPQKGEALARETGNAEAIHVDVTQPAPLENIQTNAVIQLVNDPQDFLLLNAAERGIPLVDITRWTERFQAAYNKLKTMPLSAPVILSSAWMAGTAALSALAAAQTLTTVQSVEIGIQYSLKDKSGPNAVEYLDRFAIPFEVTRGGKVESVYAFSEARKVNFLHGKPRTAYLFDIPDQFTLPRILHAETVLGRLTFDDDVSTWILSRLVRSGIWKLLSGGQFTSLRRSILYNPGKGGEHQVTIEVTGLNAIRQRQGVAIRICDPQGQTHLTALGAVTQFRRLVGADGAPAPRPGVYSPESASPQVVSAFQFLRENGVLMEITGER